MEDYWGGNATKNDSGPTNGAHEKLGDTATAPVGGDGDIDMIE